MDKGNQKNIFDREITLSALVKNLERLLDWVTAALEDAECTGRICHQIAVVTEELFVNIASYAYKDLPGGQTGDAIIRLKSDGKCLVIQFEDSGFAFNPLKQEDPNITAGIEERGIGGLGIYMIKKWMDDVVYERTNNKNILILYKTINRGSFKTSVLKEAQHTIGTGV
jgi:anti-sigma regulatory factor (Ser/Thr protein kinase)